jgi:hypothetical protein
LVIFGGYCLSHQTTTCLPLTLALAVGAAHEQQVAPLLHLLRDLVFA